ncbi:single-stranded DNA-binding protein [Salicibibacter halophilus]|uniref:Single-stranded DNA-binding protein n=1 Tax=Salicibibacter halophilus TaxID=2502791 RepID=A0A514LG62_9BACI|nr:single-stranded DNA-binding protein [Salicibibacter halophilus]QDI90241.1 single-stranded DNA-binding protein [Salicibibacter halophilus]
MSLNNVTLIGRLTRDWELRYTPSGYGVANGGIAVNRPFKNQHGENEADFFNVTVWRKQAENAASYTGKGSLVAIDGRLQSRRYENKHGQNVTAIEVVAESVQFLEPKSQQRQSNNEAGANDAGANDAGTNDATQALYGDGQQVEINDEDLPF